MYHPNVFYFVFRYVYRGLEAKDNVLIKVLILILLQLISEAGDTAHRKDTM